MKEEITRNFKHLKMNSSENTSCSYAWEEANLVLKMKLMIPDTFMRKQVRPESLFVELICTETFSL